MSEAAAAKRCTGCGQTKPLDDFGRHASRPDGHQAECKTCTRERDRRYYQANADKVSERVRRWAEANPKRVRERSRRWATANPEKERERRRRNRAQRKAQVLAHYGTVCACCGTTENLTIDHVNGDGGKHRETLFGPRKAAGDRFYCWLIRNGFPAGYQTLCAACNRSKADGVACRLAHDRGRVRAGPGLGGLGSPTCPSVIAATKRPDAVTRLNQGSDGRCTSADGR